MGIATLCVTTFVNKYFLPIGKSYSLIINYIKPFSTPSLEVKYSDIEYEYLWKYLQIVTLLKRRTRSESKMFINIPVL